MKTVEMMPRQPKMTEPVLGLKQPQHVFNKSIMILSHHFFPILSYPEPQKWRLQLRATVPRPCFGVVYIVRGRKQQRLSRRKKSLDEKLSCIWNLWKFHQMRCMCAIHKVDERANCSRIKHSEKLITSDKRIDNYEGLFCAAATIHPSIHPFAMKWMAARAAFSPQTYVCMYAVCI